MTDQTNKDLPPLPQGYRKIPADYQGDVYLESQMHAYARAALSASAPTTAPIDALSSECNECGGTGLRDLGGFYPWGEPTMIECDCISKMPTPNAPTAGSVPSDHDIEMLATGFAIQHRNGLLKFARALLAQAAPQSRVPAWHPIETAPHETNVLLSWVDWDGKWQFEVGQASWGWSTPAVSNRSCHGRATHWMSLPPAPQEGK